MSSLVRRALALDADLALELSGRERDIVELLAKGHTDESAAQALGLSRRTIAYAVKAISERFDVHSRFQLGLVLGLACGHHSASEGES